MIKKLRRDAILRLYTESAGIHTRRKVSLIFHIEFTLINLR